LRKADEIRLANGDKSQLYYTVVKELKGSIGNQFVDGRAEEEATETREALVGEIAATVEIPSNVRPQ